MGCHTHGHSSLLDSVRWLSVSGTMKFLTRLRAAKRDGRFINLQDPLPGSVPRVQFIYIRPEYEKLWETWAPQVPQPDGERCGPCPL